MGELRSLHRAKTGDGRCVACAAAASAHAGWKAWVGRVVIAVTSHRPTKDTEVDELQQKPPPTACCLPETPRTLPRSAFKRTLYRSIPSARCGIPWHFGEAFKESGLSIDSEETIPAVTTVEEIENCRKNMFSPFL